MKTISVSVSKDDYDAFRRGARRGKRSIAQLIREAMALYRQEHLEEKSRLLELPVLVGHRPLSPLPGRAVLYDEIFADGNRAP
ncbi:MAG TPA: ribbon-helix-helix protein, CopG family [Vicinamibacteria bacterium]|nr:ribbon-helix-helix protein, CopG family [Vicinamibacteria bacterium]